MTDANVGVVPSGYAINNQRFSDEIAAEVKVNNTCSR